MEKSIAQILERVFLFDAISPEGPQPLLVRFHRLSVLFGLEGKEMQADTFCPLTVRRYFCFVAADLETCFRSRFSLCFTVASFFGVILGHELTALRFAVEFAFLVVNTAGEVPDQQ